MPEHFDFEFLDGEIHTIKWHSTGHSAIVEYSVFLIDILEKMPEGHVCYILHDYTKTGTPPFSEIAKAMRKIKLPQSVALKVAHLYSAPAHLMIIKNAALVTSFNASRKFFKADEKEQAIAWLLTSDG